MRWQDSILEFTRTLVRIPSRAGVDPYDDIAIVIADWLEDHGIVSDYLRGENDSVLGMTASVSGGSGPTYLLAATLDTAPFGYEPSWTTPPLAAEVRDGWLVGRGTADSKVGVAIFCHVAASLAPLLASGKGSLELLFDADEHTGAFSGARRYLERAKQQRRLDGAFLGYPGNERLLIGSRGFERAIVDVPGRAAHSGSTSDPGINAVMRAARIARRLSEVTPTAPTTAEFPLPPKLTVTGLHGGDGFSQVPDRCQISVDIRLTPAFNREHARKLVAQVLEESSGEGPAPSIEWVAGWPAYRIPEDTPLVRVLQEHAEAVFGRPIPLAVAGPSNIGNCLAAEGVPATCGFGVTYRGAHATDEAIEISTIDQVFRAYRNTMATLLGLNLSPEMDR